MARNPIPKATDDEVAAFAAFLKKKDLQEKAERQKRDEAARGERDKVAAQQAVAKAFEAATTRKETAVLTMKRLQAGRFTFDERVEAEREYRAALADLIAMESGKRPEWAPPVQIVEAEVVIDGEAEVVVDGVADSAATAVDAPAE